MHTIIALLTEYGEKFDSKEYLMKIVEELAGPEYAKNDITVSCRKFTEKILGLQTVNDADAIQEFQKKNVKFEVEN